MMKQNLNMKNITDNLQSIKLRNMLLKILAKVLAKRLVLTHDTVIINVVIHAIPDISINC